MYVCDGTKENAEVVSESCTLVSFSIELNGGSDTVDYQGKYEAGSKVTLVEPTKEGHTFAGWIVSPEDAASINGNELTMGTVPVAITANWTKNTYTITYELDGGTNGTGNPESGEYGAEITLNNPTKEGSTFNGWTVVGGSLNDNKLTMGASNVVLTANWLVVGPPAPVSFSSDSWETIASAVHKGDTSKYNVGDTKTVTLTGYGERTLRIANKSACNGTLESETACGFVIEFADVIKPYNMNSTITNAGGWPASAMRKFLNDLDPNDNTDGVIYNALVSAIGDIIIDTKVVSSHGNGDTTGTLANNNFKSEDKLYLLSPEEVYGTSFTDSGDTSRGTSRQLDYYKTYDNKDGTTGVTTSKYAGAIKKSGSSALYWWLRSADSYNGSYYFYNVTASGAWDYAIANYTGVVSPAFRLG